MNKRLKEILQRKQEIRTALEGDESVDLSALEEELRELDNEQKEIEKRQEVAKGIATGEIEGREIPNPLMGGTEGGKIDIRSLEWDKALETEEYRTAWAKDMMGQSLNEEERSFMNKVNDEYRAFTHTTENTSILIPKTVADGIWKRAEEQSSLWADVRKLRVKGEMTMIKSDGNGDDARWYMEDETVDTDKLGFGEFNLTGCELAKAIQVSWKLRKMAVAEFEAYIMTEIGFRMGKSLAKAVYEGKGKPGVGDSFKPEPLGIKTALSKEGTTRIVEYTNEPTYKDLTGVLGSLHSAYAATSTIYANNKTVWGQLANIQDANNRPYFIADVQSGGVGRIFGLTVKVDAGIPDGEILVGNLAQGYYANINEDITMYREEHIRQRLTDYMGYAIVDGAPFDNEAFVILQKAAPVA
ncbi:phage major capsid protein [Pseudobacillus badius]|uniref:phage major capsid protein n=1 Tax=Bacillus badius TaxID=1455 RepID=UPI0024A45AEB|nr:phage major capsid protein [Bacillus badius]GLY09593.1 hypothetical protein Bbad01_08090 [Bacillus badius]